MLFTTGEANPQPAQCQHPARRHERAGRLCHQPFVPQRAREAVPLLLLRFCRPARHRRHDDRLRRRGQGGEQQAEAAIIAELEGLKNGPITREEVDDCRRGLLSSMDALGDSLAALENWYYGQITRGEPLYPPEYGKGADQRRQFGRECVRRCRATAIRSATP